MRELTFVEPGKIDGFRTVRKPLARQPGASVLVAGGGAPSVVRR
jgi:hypothetical protein